MWQIAKDKTSKQWESSMFNTFSTLLALVPDKVGFFGSFWSTIGNFFIYLGMLLVWAFYQVCKWFLAFVDFLQYFIQKLIGLDYWLSPGNKTLAGATDSDLLFSFLYNETVQDVFRALVGLFIVFLIVFTIFAIIKQEWQFATGANGAKDNSKSTIIRSSLKAIALVVIVPILLVMGIVSSNAILASIVKALNINGSTSFGNMIFSVSSMSANRYRIYTDENQRAGVSTDVTFYISGSQDDGKQIMLGSSGGADGTVTQYSITYSDYGKYLEAIEDAKQYTVDSMFESLNTSKEKSFNGFYVRIDGLDYLVKVNPSNGNNITKDDKYGMYYYLRNVLGATILTNDNKNEFPSNVWDAVKKDIKRSSDASTPEGYISDFDVDDSQKDEIYDATYNTWSYASLYNKTVAFEQSTASVRVDYDFLDSVGIQGISAAKIAYNSYDYAKYFDGGHSGMAVLNAEYGVMTDVVDFICDTGANLYVLDATSSLIDWNYDYGGSKISTKWVSLEEDSHQLKTTSKGGDDYAAFVVDYSETALEHEQGKTLYMAKKQATGNELTGSRFIMCWKVSDSSGGLRYVPLVNRETFTDPKTLQTYTFNSSYLANNYRGVVFAKGNFDSTNLVSSEIANGDPTYLKMGSDLKSGKDAIEFENSPYYYDIKEDKTLTQKAEINTDELDLVLNNVIFDSTDYSGYRVVYNSANTTFYFYNDTTLETLDVDTKLLNDITLKASEGSKNYQFNYYGQNSDGNYLFTTISGYILVVSAENNKEFSVRSVSVSGNNAAIGSTKIAPSEIVGNSSHSGLTSTKLSYEVTLNYSGATATDIVLPSEINVSTSGSKYVYSTNDKRIVEILDGNDVVYKQNMPLCFYGESNKIYNISGGSISLSEPSSSPYTMQMYKLSLYNFLTANVGGTLYACKPGGSEAAEGNVKVLEEYYFGIVTADFSWTDNSSELTVYNGTNPVAVLHKINGVRCDSYENLVSNSGGVTFAIRVDANIYYNVRSQNSFASTDDMETKYETINNSMYVGCFRDRIEQDMRIDINLVILQNWRFKISLASPAIEKEYLMDGNMNIGIFSLSEGIAFDYFFEGDNNSIMQFYNVFKIAYWIMLIAAALIIKTLGTALWGVIKRFYEITLYYLAMPIVASTLPLETVGSKSKFATVQSKLISHVLGTYGVILGLNVFFVLLQPVRSISNVFTDAEMAMSTSYFLRHFPFSAKILNSYVYILFILVAFTLIDSLVKDIPALMGVSDGDVKASGEKTKKDVGASVKNATDIISGKSAMDAGKKAVQTISEAPLLGAPIKAGVNLAKKGYNAVFGEGKKGRDGATNEEEGKDAQESSRLEKEGAEGPPDTSDPDEKNNEYTDKKVAEEANARNQSEQALEERLRQEIENSKGGDEEDNEEGEETEEDAAADAEREFNKQSFENMSDEEKTEAKSNEMKKMIDGGENPEIAQSVGENILDAAKGNVDEQGNGDGEISAENASQNGMTPEQVMAMIRAVLGEQANGMSDDDIAKNFSLQKSEGEDGKKELKLVKKDENGNKSEATLDDVQKGKAYEAAAQNASKEQLSSSYEKLDDNTKQKVDLNAAQNATVGVDVVAVAEKHKNDEDVENAVILEKMKNNGSLETFKKETSLGDDASEADILQTIAVMKNSDDANAAKLTLESMGGVDDDYIKVVGNKMASGEIKETAWTLATEEERQAAIAKKREEKGILTAEEKEVKSEMQQEKLAEMADSNAAEYGKLVVESFAGNKNIDNKSEVLNAALLAAAGLDNKDSQEYKNALAAVNKSIDANTMLELQKKGISQTDMLTAYAKHQILQGKDAKFSSKDLMDIVQNQDEFDADVLKEMQEGTMGDHSELNAKFAKALMKGDGEDRLAFLTDEEQEAINKKIIKNHKNDDALNVDYKDVVNETKTRKSIDEVGVTQAASVDANMMNAYAKEHADDANYQALLAQIAEMKGLKPEEVTELTDADLDALVHNDVNVGFDPVELQDLKKSIIEAKVRGGEDFTKTTNENNLSEKEKNDFEYKKAIIEDQMKGEDGKEVIANLFNNSNFVGKSELEELVKKLMADNPEMSRIDAINKALEGKDNVKEVLKNIGATDVTKALDEKTLFDKQKEVIENDAVLSKQLEDAGIKKEFDSNGNQINLDDYNNKIKQFMEGNFGAVQKENMTKDETVAMMRSLMGDKVKNLSDDALLKKYKMSFQKDSSGNDVAFIRDLSNIKQVKGEIFSSNKIDKALNEIKKTNDPSKFNSRLNANIQSKFDPNNHISEEDKQNFFKSIKGDETGIVGLKPSIKNAFNAFIEENNGGTDGSGAKRFGKAISNKITNSKIAKNFNYIAETSTGDIIKGVGKRAWNFAKYKTVGALPKEHKKYDEWNKVIDKDIAAVKQGKGAYASMSQEERRQKLEELNMKKIHTKTPDDFHTWSNEKQTAFMVEQNKAKTEAYNMSMSKLNKQNKKLNPVKNKGIIANLADQVGYDLANKNAALSFIVSRFASDELKQKHQNDLIAADANISRYKASEPMRNKTRDFGAGFNEFAKTYLDKNGIDKVNKALEDRGIKKGDNSDAAIKAREEEFAKLLNAEYKQASARVARDNKVKPAEYLTEKGIDAGNVRYKDGTKKYLQVKSRIPVRIPGISHLIDAGITAKRKKAIDNYEKEYAETGGNVSDKTREKYQKSYYGKRSQEAAIRAQNEGKALEKKYQEMLEFNRTYSGSKQDYEKTFKAKFGDELYQKYDNRFRNLLKQRLQDAPLSVQQRGLLQQMMFEMSKNAKRQVAAGAHISAPDYAKAQMSASGPYKNKISRANVDNIKQVSELYGKDLHNFMNNKNGKSIEELMNDLTPRVRDEISKKLGKIISDTKIDENQKKEAMQRLLEGKLNKYNAKAYNNTFTSSDLEKLKKLGGTYLDPSQVSRSRISPTIKKSLSASDTKVYENILKNVAKAKNSYNAENVNLEALKKALTQVQSGIQNNAAKQEAERLKKAIRNSQIKVSNLGKLVVSEEERQKAFERAIASGRIKEAQTAKTAKIAQTSQTSQTSKTSQTAQKSRGYNESDYNARFRGKAGKVDYSDLRPDVQRDVRRIMDEFKSKYKSELDYLLKLQNTNLQNEIRRSISNLDNKFVNNYQNLKSLQEDIRRRMTTLVNKKDRKSKEERDSLKMAQTKLNNTLKELKEKIRNLGIEI